MPILKYFVRCGRAAVLSTLVLLACCAERDVEGGADVRAAPEFRQKGKASWYGPGFHGKATAFGETFNQNDLTAAHRSLPPGTEVEVTNLTNGRSINVTINDRGPYVRGRVIDLSRAAAIRLGIRKEGVVTVKIEADSVQTRRGARPN